MYRGRYVLGGDDFIEYQKLVALDGTGGEQYGYAMSMSESITVIGANNAEEGRGMTAVSMESSFSYHCVTAGAVYVYERANSGHDYSLSQQLLASDRATDDRFGGSVSVYYDTIVVGAYFENEKATAAGLILCIR